MAVLDGIQSALNPQGHDSEIIAEIAWVLFAGGAAIFVAVMAIAAYALLARRDRSARLASRGFVVGGGIVFPTVTLAVAPVAARYDDGSPWVGAMFLWNLNFAVLWGGQGNPDHEQASFGILNPDWSPRPSFNAVQGLIAQLKQKQER